MLQKNKYAYINHAVVALTGYLFQPILTCTVSFLTSFNHCPSAQHITAAHYVGCYLLSTLERCISFSSDQHDTLSSYVHILFKEDCLMAFADAHWGPQDKSAPSTPIKVPMDKLWSKSGSVSICNGAHFLGMSATS
eukprot:15324529-Ditylum_brightwellii.AAC.1